MALQGTLETFALPDVLRLLASTKKTGCYRLDGDRGSGRLWVKDGQLVGGEFSGAPQVDDVTEVTFELLRFADGDFVFDADAEHDDSGEALDVEATLESAEKLLEEWNEIAAVVPSLDAWVSLRADLPGDEVTIRADRWIYVVAVGGGATVGRLGTMLGQGELPICRTVKDLLELGVVELGDAPSGAPAASTPVAEAAPADTTFETTFEGDSFGGSFGEESAFEAEADAPSDGGGDAFEPFDPNALVIGEPEFPSAEDMSSGALPDDGGLAPFQPFEPVEEEVTSLAEESVEEAAPTPGATDAAEIARQLANLSPKAAKAVAAAAKATTQEEREAALAEVDDEEDPINRELLLKFLGSVNS